jgi:hypothetical protein
MWEIGVGEAGGARRGSMAGLDWIGTVWGGDGITCG